MSEATHQFELGWFRYLCEKYPGKVYISNRNGEMLIVVQDE